MLNLACELPTYLSGSVVQGIGVGIELSSADVEDNKLEQRMKTTEVQCWKVLWIAWKVRIFETLARFETDFSKMN
jgi:hypothetical protein